MQSLQRAITFTFCGNFKIRRHFVDTNANEAYKGCGTEFPRQLQSTAEQEMRQAEQLRIGGISVL
jgi:hypothetical protein